MSIHNKLLLIFFFVTALSVGLLSIVAINNSTQTIKQEVENALNSIADEKLEKIYSYINEKEQSVATFANLPVVAKALEDLSVTFAQGVNSTTYLAQDEKYHSSLAHLQRRLNSYDLFLIDRNGNIVFTVIHEADFATNLKTGPYNTSQLAKVFDNASTLLETRVSTFERYSPSQWELGQGVIEKQGQQGTEVHSAFIAAPVFNKSKLLGVLAIQLNSNDYYHLASDYTGIRRTGELVIGKLVDDQALIIAPLRRNPEAAFNLRYPIGSEIALPIQRSVTGENGSGLSIGYEGTEILAAWRYIPELQWGLVVKVEAEEAFAAVDVLKRDLTLMGLGIALLAAAIILYLSRRLLAPLLTLVDVTKRIAEGDLNQQISLQASGEIGELVDSFNRMLIMRNMHEHALELGRVQAEAATKAKIELLTERKQADDALRESEQRQRDFLNNTSSIIYMKDLDGAYLFVNKMFESLVHISDQDMKGKTDYDFFPRDACDVFRRNDLMAIESDEPIDIEEFIDFEEGKRTYHSVKFSLKKASGEVYAVCGISTDITKRKRLEEQLRMHREHLEDLVEQRTKELKTSLEDLTRTQDRLVLAEKIATTASKTKSQFLAHMSHEIRTPMNGIIAMADLLMDNEQNEERFEYARIIKHSGTALLTIINDILDISKIEAGKMVLDMRSFILKDILNDVATIFNAEFSKKKIHFNCTINADVPNVIVSDSTRLRQILINLLGNGIKFTHDNGSIGLFVSVCKNKALQLSKGSICLEFRVQDSGIGIPKEMQGKLFNAFAQGDSSVTRKFGGTGLGLQICARLCKIMGGDINFESIEGVGTTFIFTINTKPGRIDNKIIPESVQKSKIPACDVRILLVEDNVVNQKVAFAVLNRLEYAVKIVANGKEAIDEVHAHHYDIVLMDCQMPVLDGYEATRRLRLEKCFKNLPIIAMTASATLDEHQKCKDVGMNDFLSKPIDINSVKTVLAKWH